jgi:hypothetical protein
MRVLLKPLLADLDDHVVPLNIMGLVCGGGDQGRAATIGL